MVRVDATVSKPGVYNYTRADGSIVREYLPPDEVTKADSLASLEDATVTNRHPGNMVDASSWSSVSIGHARSGRADGDKAVATLVISRADAQSKIGTELVEVSRGVRVDLDNTPGVTPSGEKYDAIQRNVVYNHIAVGPRGWGRQGAEVALRLDSNGDELFLDATDAQDTLFLDTKEHPMAFKYDGKEFKTDAELTAYIDGLKVRADGANPFAKKGEEDDEEADKKKKAEKKDAAEALAKEKARADAAQAKLDAIDLKAKQDARAVLETQGKAVLGAAQVFDSALTDTQVRLAVLAKLTPSVKYDGKSDMYVESAFDIALASQPATERSRSDAMAAGLHGVVLGGTNPSLKQDGTEDPLARLDARERMIARNATLASPKA